MLSLELRCEKFYHNCFSYPRIFWELCHPSVSALISPGVRSAQTPLGSSLRTQENTLQMLPIAQPKHSTRLPTNVGTKRYVILLISPMIPDDLGASVKSSFGYGMLEWHEIIIFGRYSLARRVNLEKSLEYYCLGMC